MIIKCPECDLNISNKAYACPHCGYPLKDRMGSNKENTHYKRRRRLPNGFGQISEIKDMNLRNRFRVMVPVGKNSKGKPICKLLKPTAYFRTYNEAYEALVEYNKNPYDLDSKISVKELYEQWSNAYFKTLNSDTSIRTITCAWKYCSSLYDMRACDLRARHIKGCIDEGYIIKNGNKSYPSAGVKGRIKSLFNLMLDYALEFEIVDKNYARTFNISDDIVEENKNNRREHIPFSSEEMAILWDNCYKKDFVDIILIQCYSGWRPQELGLIKIENVDLDGWTFIGGIKTDAGFDRAVPIHPKIRPLVKRRYDEALRIGSYYLLNSTASKDHFLTYAKYDYRFGKIVSELKLNPEHRAHDGRKHFVTVAKNANVDEYAIKYLVGHKINDITEAVYTKRELDWLRAEIEKIK